jgi:arylsulfatase A-like enzyme
MILTVPPREMIGMARESDRRPQAGRFYLCGLVTALAVAGGGSGLAAADSRRPNVVLLLADQWRAEALGCAGNPDVKTPELDRLQREAVYFVNAVSSVPVCSPARASLLTGQRALTHGVFLNDVPLSPRAVTLSSVLRQAGYDTAYIGKWHLDGHGRSSYIPRQRRQGFEYWKALECTHDYPHSSYYADGPEKLPWPGYDAAAQTRDAVGYLHSRARSGRPFFLFLSWGPPHDPYGTAPAEYGRLYDAPRLRLRPNVPAASQGAARAMLAGYYAHCSALDHCVGEVRAALAAAGLARNTILVFTSDHGDLLGSHGQRNKQQPFDESIRVPLLLAWPQGLGTRGARPSALVSTEDLMPTLLGLCGLGVPGSVEGLDYSGYLRGGKDPSDGAALVSCVAPFGQWTRRTGGREYRGIRTARYTFVRDLAGPWLLFDNQADPYQMQNLAGRPEAAKLQGELDATLQRKLDKAGDRFQPAEYYIRQWGYQVDASGTVPYTN